MKNSNVRRRLVLRQALLPACMAAALAAGAVSGSPGQLDLSRPSAVTLVVTSCADDGTAGTLRSAVASAASGDVVDLTALSCGTITLLSGQIEVQVDELTIEGPGADSLTIDGNHGDDDYYIANGRVFNDVGTQNLTINNVTIANGLVFNPFTLAYGGCINASGPIVMNNVVVTGCRAVTCQSQAGGGGIASQNMHGYAQGISLTDSVVTGNETIAKFCPAYPLYSFGVNGGGIESRGPIGLTNSLITNNQVHSYAPVGSSSYPTQAAGGGIMAYFGLLTITGSVVSDNFAGCHTDTELCYNAVGAGIRAEGGLTIESTTITGNIAEGQNVLGAGIELENGLNQQLIFQINNSTISDNHGVNGAFARNWGGGVEAEYNVALEIFNSTIVGNTADLGGGIHVEGAQMTLSNTTVSGNTAGVAGGGVFVQEYAQPLLTLQNSTITLNRSSGSIGGGGVVDASGQIGVTVLQSSILAGNINDVTGTTYDADLGVATGAVNGSNNLIIAASGVTLPPDTLNIDPMLGPLQDNGGPTWTHALDPSSPAIDAGNNVAGLDFDQRGTGFPRVSGIAADIGAFEIQVGAPDAIFANGFDASP